MHYFEHYNSEMFFKKLKLESDWLDHLHCWNYLYHSYNKMSWPHLMHVQVYKPISYERLARCKEYKCFIFFIMNINGLSFQVRALYKSSYI